MAHCVRSMLTENYTVCSGGASELVRTLGGGSCTETVNTVFFESRRGRLWPCSRTGKMPTSHRQKPCLPKVHSVFHLLDVFPKHFLILGCLNPVPYHEYCGTSFGQVVFGEVVVLFNLERGIRLRMPK